MRTTIAFLALVALASAAFAADSPHTAWIKAKCAVCHGEDGAGKNPEGKRRNVPDLRSNDIQKHTDAELFDMIAAGHGKMPSFKAFNKDHITLLVAYIRSIAAK